MRCSIIKEDIWQCNLHPEDVKKLKFNNQFWKDVLSSWNLYNHYKNKRVENQLIWYNSQIIIGHKPVLWADTYLNGLKYVHQLFEHMEFKSSQQVWREFGLTKLRYNSLKMAIPTDWKKYFMQNPKGTYMPIPPHNYDAVTLPQEQNTSGDVYRFISEDVMIMHNKYMKWRNEIGPSFCESIVDFGKLHTDLYRLTNVTKYRSFQYRLLQRGIITNIHLFRWNIKASAECSFCHTEQETLTHLFCECTKIQELWAKIAQYIRKELKVQPNLITTEPIGIITNRIVPKKDHVANFVCLITKQYIYKQRCLEQELNFECLKAQIRRVESIEKYIAIKNNKVLSCKQ